MTNMSDSNLSSESGSSFPVLSDILIIAAVVLAGGYYVLSKKKKKPEFDADLINTIPTEPRRGSRTGSVSESGFIGKLATSNTNVAVFYGSQTGTAEEYACRLAKEAARYGMKGKALDPEECDMDKLRLFPDMIKDSLAIFCIATYGEGDPTDNSREFFDALESSSESFENLNYAVFALGNKTYEHFNSAGIYVDKRLAELGANRICEIGLGDDDANIEEDFVTWKEKMWTNVCSHYGVEQAAELTNQRQYELIVHDPNDLTEGQVFSGEIARINSSASNQTPPFDAKNPFYAKVTENRNLYKGERTCMHIEVDITSSSMRYETGDHLAIYAKNNSELVDKLGELLGVDLDQVITLKNLDSESSKRTPFPCPCSYRTALTYYVDINQTPTTYILKELAEYAADEEHKKLLKDMSSYSDEGKSLYSDWVLKNCRNIVHILEDLPTVKPALDHLLEMLPRLQPRFYSISSSPKVHANSVHVTAVLVDYETPTKRKIKGTCTSFLLSRKPDALEPGSTIICFVRKSQFRLPPKTETPMIMIGPGTGVAPFRAFIQERDWFRQQGRTVGDTILYYGCRKQSEDYLYQEELNTYKENGTLKLYVAFSRDQAEKVYVTHLLREHMDEVWDVIGNKNGNLYVCGDAKSMAKNVKDIILETIQQKGNKTKVEAESFFKKMESQRKFSADVWS